MLSIKHTDAHGNFIANRLSRRSMKTMLSVKLPILHKEREA